MAPRLPNEREEVAALLDPLAAVQLGADQPERFRLGDQLHVRPRGAGEVARTGHAHALGDHVRDPIARPSVSPIEKPPIV